MLYTSGRTISRHAALPISGCRPIALRPHPGTTGEADHRQIRVPLAQAPHDLRRGPHHPAFRSEEHTSELQSLMRTSYAVFCLKKKKEKYQVSIHRTSPLQTV